MPKQFENKNNKKTREYWTTQISDHANIGPSTKDTSERKDKGSEQVTFSCTICGNIFRLSKKHKLINHERNEDRCYEKYRSKKLNSP